MVGGIRDIILFHETKLLMGFVAVFVAAFLVNLAFGNFHPGFANQPIAHTDGLWNFLGMALAGFCSILLGGCPMRQLIMTGEGNTDSAITVLGLVIGAAFAHNFGLAASGNGPTFNGEVAVVLGFVVALIIAVVNTRKQGTEGGLVMIDARGYSCPEPVIMAQKALATQEQEYEMLVDSRTAMENVTRYVSHNGYTVVSTAEGDDYKLVFKKK